MNNHLRDPFNLRRNLLNPANRAPGAANALAQLNILRTTASQVATQVTERVAETAAEAIERGKQAVEDLREQRERGKEKKDDDYNQHNYDDNHNHSTQDPELDNEKDMSFTVPKNVPSFSNPQRALEDRVWGSSGVTARTARGGTGGGIIGEGLDKFGDFLNPNRGTLPLYKDKPYGYPPSSRSQPFYRRKRYMAWFLILVLAVAYWFGMFGQEARIPSLKSATWLKAEGSGKVDWLERRERVVEAFELSWDSYKRYGWGGFSPQPSQPRARRMRDG